MILYYKTRFGEFGNEIFLTVNTHNRSFRFSLGYDNEWENNRMILHLQPSEFCKMVDYCNELGFVEVRSMKTVEGA